MANDPKYSARERIVTLESLKRPPTLEGAPPPRQPKTEEEELRVEQYFQIAERLRQETDAAQSSNVMVTVPDPEVSRLQSEFARQAAAGRTLTAGGLEAKFGSGIAGGDWFGWILSLMDHVRRKEAHPMIRPQSTTPDPLPDSAKIAMAADWGTGLYGAPKIAQHIAATGGFELLMHLGDVYYSGTREEVQERFLDIWPKAAGKRSVAVNSNHEMYSGGFGYFELALPAFGQKASYVAFENSHWLLIVLDTAYVDHDIDIEQVAWLNLVIKQSKDRNGGQAKKLVLFSHQQLFSRLEGQGPKLERALRHLLESKAITAWYWGHEHNCVIYDQHADYGLRGRCLGNGGIPSVREKKVKDLPDQQTIGQYKWKRLSGTSDSPGCIVLDGPNPDVEGETEKFVPHGYMTLELNGPTLTERVLVADGTEVLRNTFQ